MASLLKSVYPLNIWASVFLCCTNPRCVTLQLTFNDESFHFVIKPEHRILMCQNNVHMMAYQDIKVTFINPGNEVLPKYLDEQHYTHFKSTIHGNILEWKKLVNLANI